MSDTKTCNRCQRGLAVTAFAVARSNPDGRQRTCRTCMAAYLQARREADPERTKDEWRRGRARYRAKRLAAWGWALLESPT